MPTDEPFASAPATAAPTAGSPRLPRWAKVLLIAVLALALLFVLRLALGIGAALAYYGSNPDFASLVAERRTEPARVEAWLPTGEVLSEDEAWSVGETRTASDETRSIAVDVEIRHGDELLLATTVDIEAVLERATLTRRGFSVQRPQIRTRDGMRAVVQVSLLGVRGSLGEIGKGRVYVDAVLAAGDGENAFRVVELDKPAPQFDSSDPVPSVFRMLLGLVHPALGPPEEGLLYQTRSGFFLSWRKLEGGAQGVGTSPKTMRTNGAAYSYAITARARYSDVGQSSGSSETNWRQTYTWNDRLW